MEYSILLQGRREDVARDFLLFTLSSPVLTWLELGVDHRQGVVVLPCSGDLILAEEIGQRLC